MLVYVRPSNEALPRARVPGAQDQYGCPSRLSDCAAPASKKDGLATPLPPFGGRALREHRRSSGSIPSSAGAVGGRKFCYLNGPATYGGLEMVCENPAYQGLFH